MKIISKKTSITENHIKNFCPTLFSIFDSVYKTKAIIEKLSKNIEKSVKDSKDFCTQADIAIEKHLVSFFKENFEHKIISEELANEADFNNKDSFWIIDPLDGTSAFSIGLDKNIPSIMIALVEAGVITHSIVFFPFTDDFYYAVKDKGAFKNGQKIKNNFNNSILDSHAIVNCYQNKKFNSKNYEKVNNFLFSENGPQITTICSPNSGVALRTLDSNSTALVFHDNSTEKIKQGIWDIAPIKLIVEEAGCLYTDINFKNYKLNSCLPIFIFKNKEIKKELTANF